MSWLSDTLEKIGIVNRVIVEKEVEKMPKQTFKEGEDVLIHFLGSVKKGTVVSDIYYQFSAISGYGETIDVLLEDGEILSKPPWMLSKSNWREMPYVSTTGLKEQP